MAFKFSFDQKANAEAPKDFDLSIDWLSFTYPSGSAAISSEITTALAQAIASAIPKACKTSRIFDDAKPCVSSTVSIVESKKGMHGYTDSGDIVYFRDGEAVELGKCAWGGASQRGKVYVSLNSVGSKLLDKDKAKAMLQALKAKISRLDIALDDFNGSYPVEVAFDAYNDGLFTTGGKRPGSNLIFDMGNKKGNTLYIGKRGAKLLRVYEKGRQLGEKESPWVRYEVELSGSVRDIPYDSLDDLGAVFLGSYGWLSDTFSEIVKAVPRRLRCDKKKREIDASQFIQTFSTQYGKLFNFLDDAGIELGGFVNVIKREGRPSRFDDTHSRDFRLSIMQAYRNGVLAHQEGVVRC